MKITTYADPKNPTRMLEGEWTYRCGGCGDEIDEDHDYCSPCDMRGGAWELTGEDGEAVDLTTRGPDTFLELVSAVALYLARLEEVLEEPDMQRVVDIHGNEACRRVRGGTRVAAERLRDVMRRAKL